MTLALSDLLRSSGVDDIAQQAEHRTLVSRVAADSSELRDGSSAKSLIRVAQIVEARAVNSAGKERTDYFDRAFSCWRDVSSYGQSYADEVDGDLLPWDLSLAVHVAVSGTQSGRVSEVRQELTRLLPSAELLGRIEPQRDWARDLLRDVALSFVLLTRKADGWADISLALELMAGLRDKQSKAEEAYMSSRDDEYSAAISLLGCYHLAQMVTTAGKFVETGQGASEGVLVRLDTHRQQAVEAFTLANDPRLIRLADLFNTGVTELVRNSIWSQVETLGAGAGRLAATLAAKASMHPLLELWPSQQEAMQSNLLDVYPRAMLVEMPTSSGKTLLAKFAIVQTHALNPEATIAYVVPTRVLVNQVTDELRRDLRDLKITVEQAVPVFELDPTEDALLSTPPNVLVTTPEKLDLLVRSNHVSLNELSMVIVDEAHNIGDGDRGARLELVLATIRRDRPKARYLLLSPFIPNGEDLVAWLGDARSLPPIRVDWKPNKRVVGALEQMSEGRKHRVNFTTVDAVLNSDLPANVEILLGQPHRKLTSGKAISLAAARYLSERGSTLIICRGKLTAAHRATELANELPEMQLSKFAAAVIRHVSVELGEGNPLAEAIRHGVAYHHAGLSLETRRLIETLVRREEIRVVCGTTTLAQGVNFPIANVIIEDRRKGRNGHLSYSDFWNMAGRAGRGLMSDLGVIGYPVTNEDQKADWKKFFKGEAADIGSQLATLVTQADIIGTKFDLHSLRTNPVLSSFLQYLAHAMKVSGSFDAGNEIEDLLRSSLVYREAQSASQESADKLIRLCRAYLNEIQGKQALVALADGTGFSTPTINALLARASDQKGLRDRENWAPELLFGDDVTELTKRVQLLADLPEIKLSDDEGGAFNAERIARILRDWVNGSSVADLADKYGDAKAPVDKRRTDFAGYLYSSLTGTASWGMGALESVTLAGTQGDDDAGHVPSMIYFGVNRKEAVWLRMAGLTREGATRAAALWRTEERPAPTSYSEIRTWISGITADAWNTTPGAARLTGAEMITIWDELHS